MSLPDQLIPFEQRPTRTGGHITADRLERLLKIEAALDRISTTSPALSEPGTPRERRCVMCHALIDEARTVLGYAPWPAIPRTPINPTTGTTP